MIAFYILTVAAKCCSRLYKVSIIFILQVIIDIK
jgi:hypothetical protein